MQLSAMLQMDYNYTPKQGQFLAFIYYYTKLNGESPSELDMARYFGITVPSVHRMVVTLEERNFITRVPFRADLYAYSCHEKNYQIWNRIEPPSNRN